MKYLKKDVLRLAGTYLAIIMTMSIGFSILLFSASTHELGRRPHDMDLGSPFRGDRVQQYFEMREQESRRIIIVELLLANFAMLTIGGLMSYLLAERTLRPIEHNMAAQAQFVSDASHELRTPLTALRTANEVALRSKTLKLRDARQVFQENIDDIARLQGLTDSMLGLVRDDLHTSTHDVNLQAVVSDAMNLVAPLALQKSIAIDDRSRPIIVRADHQSLVQLLTILLDNAIKYSNDTSTIQIVATTKGKKAFLSVRDEGIGMDAATAEQAFARFYRAETARNSAGYGLGLAIAKKIVSQAAGTISVDSTPGKGSTFTVILPTSKH